MSSLASIVQEQGGPRCKQRLGTCGREVCQDLTEKAQELWQSFSRSKMIKPTIAAAATSESTLSKLREDELLPKEHYRALLALLKASS